MPVDEQLVAVRKEGSLDCWLCEDAMFYRRCPTGGQSENVLSCVAITVGNREIRVWPPRPEKLIVIALPEWCPKRKGIQDNAGM